MTKPTDKIVPRGLYFETIGALSRYDGRIIFNAKGMGLATRLIGESKDYRPPTDPSSTDTQPTRYRIIESKPDKNNIVIIGIKEDQNGEFSTKNDALACIRINHAIKKHDNERLLDAIAAFIQEHKIVTCEDIELAYINVNTLLEKIKSFRS
jgi:hypothetical protein